MAASAAQVQQEAAAAQSAENEIMPFEQLLRLDAGKRAPPPRKLTQAAQALNTELLAVGDFDPAEVVSIVSEWLKGFASGLGTNQDLGQVTQDIVEHFLYAFPKWNVMVVNPPHIASFQQSVHQDINVPYDYVLSRHYDVYIFKSGSFTLLGDGGYQHWCFGGNFSRNGKHVTFSER